jgi:hypothetical protein
MRSFSFALLAAAALSLLVACKGEEKGGPMEKAGREADRAIGQAGKAVEQAGKDMQDTAKGKK